MRLKKRFAKREAHFTLCGSRGTRAMGLGGDGSAPSDDGKVIAPVEELELVAPGNALVWELVQDKGMDRAELRDRIATMIRRQAGCACDPDYITRVHRDGYTMATRSRIVNLYLEVSLGLVSQGTPHLKQIFRVLTTAQHCERDYCSCGESSGPVPVSRQPQGV